MSVPLASAIIPSAIAATMLPISGVTNTTGLGRSSCGITMPPAFVQTLPKIAGAYQAAPTTKYASAATSTASQFRSPSDEKLITDPLCRSRGA